MMTGGLMTKYRVYGDKAHRYYIDVQADSREEAWELALQSNSVWFETETDDVIEPFAVEEYN